MRRLAAILVIVVILVALWAGGWFWLAGYVERNVEPMLREVARRGVEVECPDRRVVGFPFALRVVCGPTDLAEASTGTRASLPGATGGASVFRPTTAEISLKSPVRIESPLLEGPAELRWQDAAVDFSMSLGGPRAVAFDASDVLGAFAAPGLPEQTVAATHAAAELAPSAGGTDVAVQFTDLAVASGGDRFPPVSGTASAELSVPPQALARGRAGIELPVEARGIRLSMESGGARFMMEGDLSLDAEALMNGTLVLRVAGVEALPQFIAALPQQFQKVGNAVAAGLFAFGQPTTLDGKQASEVRVTIAANRATIGPIVFDLPRLRL
jgi:hypothetical protein